MSDAARQELQEWYDEDGDLESLVRLVDRIVAAETAKYTALVERWRREQADVNTIVAGAVRYCARELEEAIGAKWK